MGLLRFLALILSHGNFIASFKFLTVAVTKDAIQARSSEVLTYPAVNGTQSYADAILRVPPAFYYNALTGIILIGDLVKQRKFPGSVLSPTSSSNAKMLRRPMHDTFRPPCGPPVKFLTSVGYSKEVGLPDGMQEVYDPCTQRSFILDHNASKIIMDDFRPKQRKQVAIKPSLISLGNGIEKNIPFNVCTQAAVIKQASTRAQSKPVGCTFLARGKDGCPGISGEAGICGADGANGRKGDTGFLGIGAKRNGQPGIDGRVGGRGSNGGRGGNGQRGGDVILTLSGSADTLQVTGSKEFKAHLGGTKSDHILLVDCHGGNGGRGGSGGVGGKGGIGGEGGDGVRGNNSVTPGHDGGDGGNGGHGGDGGQGGKGGDSGDGGNAGDGGKCLVETADPRLLMLVEVDCMSGEPGVGVNGGKGGAGGKPGTGGTGGPGGEGGPATTTESYSSSGERRIVAVHSTYRGYRGQDGTSGNRGRNGACGMDSRRGRIGSNGGLLWVVKNGGKIWMSSTRYDAKVERLQVLPAQKDGIFEPNEKITVFGVLVHNTGGLDLPSGASAFIPSTQTIKFESSHFDIPDRAVVAGKRYTIPFEFHGRIMDLAPPNQPGCQCFKAEFSARIELLGRPFEKSSFKKELNVQYPIQLGNLHCPATMDRGEVALISIEVNNLSSLPYGTCKGSGGRVVLRLHFDARIIPVGKVAADADCPYVVTYDHSIRDSTFIELHEIPARKRTTVNIRILMENSAELFDECRWQVDLHLRDKLIEYNSRQIRITPTYNQQKPPSDVLLVTSEMMTHQEFVFWHSIFDILGVSYDIWDTYQYRGFSVDTGTSMRHKNSWFGRYVGKMILYPHCNLQLLLATDIAHHYHGDTFREKPLQERESSLIVFMPQSNHNEMTMLRHLAVVHPRVEVPQSDYSGKHLFSPNPQKDPLKWEKNFFKKLEDKNLNQASLLLSRQVNISYIGHFKYSYGSIDVRQLPILKSSKLLVIDGVGGLSDANLSPFSTDIPLASRYGQAILATLCGISISAKLRLMKKQPVGYSQPNNAVFFLPDKSSVCKEELVMITLAWEVADELFSCSGEASRMKVLYDDIKDNTDSYLECGRVIMRGLKLIDMEFKKRRSAGLRHYRVMQGYGKIKDMSASIGKILVEAGVDNSKLEAMASLEKLQDHGVHRCHQHFAKEGIWNLVDI